MSKWVLSDDCFVHDRDRLRHDEVIEILRERLGPVTETETVSLSQACGRILAQGLEAPRALPGHDNAAVDGYAVRYADLHQSEPTELAISVVVPAGIHQNLPELAQGTAARIFTGAIMPHGGDTVLMQEDCQTDESGTYVLIPPGIKLGANRRRAGEDVRESDTICQAGKRLGPADVARFASLGIAAVPVRNKLRVAILSSGNEIISHESDDLPLGGVFDANGPLLQSLAEALPTEVNRLPVIQDDLSITKQTLKQAAESHHVILTSGGASKGDGDHLRAALTELGQCHLWQLAIKPGRPMMMGQIGSVPVFGLPGNPVAVFICWCLYAYPSLLRLAGTQWRDPVAYPLPAGFDVPKKKTDRREFYRGWTETNNEVTTAMKFMRDGSGLISGLQAATGLIEIPESASSVTQGERVRFIPFDQFGI
jgi:molybdopterin molybdotransferase